MSDALLNIVYDAGARSTLIIGLIAALIARQQNRIARQSLFTSLLSKRQEWLSAFIRAVTDRETEISTLEPAVYNRGDRPPDEALLRVARLRQESQWLFGSELYDTAKELEAQLTLKFQYIWNARSRHQELGDKGGHDMALRAAETAGTIIGLGDILVKQASPYLYVGDVKLKQRRWRVQ
jgi:hypothetical protein